MPLTSGTRLGPYEVLSSLGAGGMGEVYRARDNKLGRDVALKILPDAFANDPERLARFEREAKTLASLNHPHIAQIYGFEQSGTTSALVMELVEGEDLSQRIARGPIPLDEALPIARQIADALEAAHETGIIHRDLKPANIKLRADGSLKVLDFGLAKAVEVGGTEAPPSGATLTSPAMTMRGMILGTAAYMAPEQAKGKPVDKRADIWAFGVVFAEMLAGERPFQGENLTELLASVVKDQPDIRKTPPRVHSLLRKCLQKDPRHRLRDIGDAWALLPDEANGGAAPAARWTWLPWAVAAAFAIAALALAVVQFREPAAASPAVVRFQLPVAQQAGGSSPGISPDGKRLLYFTANQLWVRDLDAIEARSIPDTDGQIVQPFWSADSRFVVFSSRGTLKRADGSGGPSQSLCALPGLLQGGFTVGDRIVFASIPGGLLECPASGGSASTVPAFEGQKLSIRGGSALLPNGNHFVYTVLYESEEKRGIFMASLDGKDPPKQLLPDFAAAAYVPAASGPSGYLLFRRGGALMAQPFSAASLEIAGDPVRIVDQVGQFSASPNGVIVYDAGDTGNRLTWFDRRGTVSGTVGAPGGYLELSMSPDDSRVAVVRVDIPPATWIHDFATEASTRPPFAQSSIKPVWFPDGRQIVVASNRGTAWDLFRSVATGSRQEELLFKSDGFNAPRDISRDGRWLMYTHSDPKTKEDLWLLPLQGERKPEPFLVTDYVETDGMFSPDGRFIVYVSNESGIFEIYVRSFPASTGGKWRVSNGGAYQPRWRRDGKELFFFTADGRLMSVAVTPGATFQHSATSTLFQVPIFGGGATTSNHYWDVTSDGQRFLINTTSLQSKSAALTVVLNWQAGLAK